MLYHNVYTCVFMLVFVFVRKPMDMWYVLEPPRGMTMSRAAAKAKKRGSSTEDEVTTKSSVWHDPINGSRNDRAYAENFKGWCYLFLTLRVQYSTVLLVANSKNYLTRWPIPFVIC